MFRRSAFPVPLATAVVAVKIMVRITASWKTAMVGR